MHNVVVRSGGGPQYLLHDVGLDSVLQHGYDLVVTDEDKSTADRADDIGEVALEHALHALVLHDLLGTVDGTAVHLLPLSTHHHQPPPDGVEGVGDADGEDGHALGDGELDQDVRLLEHRLDRVVGAEVEGPVDDDSLDADEEPGVETPHQALGLVGLDHAVEEALELAVSGGLADVGTKTGPGKVERIDDQERRGSSCTAGGEVAGEESPELGVPVDAVHEKRLVLVFEGKVEGLGGEIPNNVDDVTAPEGEKALLCLNSFETVDHAGVPLILGDEFLGILNLKQQLDSLDGRNDGFGDGGRNSSGDEVQHEIFAVSTHCVGWSLSLKV